ncbi:MAG: hypothetical protein NTV88_00160 [Candidatus Micrarchaeota archaeon]|nr:hypothetical protein [Candidatus Micrarchaeota archaeon]
MKKSIQAPVNNTSQPKKALIVLYYRGHESSVAAKDIVRKGLESKFGSRCLIDTDLHESIRDSKGNLDMKEFRVNLETRLAKHAGKKLVLDIEIGPMQSSGYVLSSKIRHNNDLAGEIFNRHIANYFKKEEWPRWTPHIERMYGNNHMNPFNSPAITLVVGYEQSLPQTVISELVMRIGKGATDAVRIFLKLNEPDREQQIYRYIPLAVSSIYKKAEFN